MKSCGSARHSCRKWVGNLSAGIPRQVQRPAAAYSSGGEPLSTSHALNRTSSDEYDSRYRLVQTKDANGGVTQTVLDPAGNRIKLIDPDNNETDWTFSATNLPLTETNAQGTATTAYDAASQITSIEDADGRVRDFLHDNLGRLTAENWMQGGTVIASMSYGYDAANELTSASDANSAYAFAYNGDAQVTSVDNAGTPNVPHVVLTGTLDAMGERTSLSTTINGTADFLNSYSYDADQRLTMVQQQGVNGGDAVSPKEVDYGYNALGQFTSAVDFNFIGVGPRLDVLSGAYSYDNDARLTGLAYTSSGGKTTIDTLGWDYNAGSLVTSFSSIDGTADYGNDATNQLTSASYTTASGGHQPANENDSYDLNGNRASSGYSTGSDNEITSDGTFNYQYDADGNTTVRTRISSAYATDYKTTYTWDYRNRLTDVDDYDNNGVLTKHVHYVFGVFDHLLATEVDSTGSGQYDNIQHYVLGVSPQAPSAGVPGTALAQPVLQFDGNGTLTLRFLVGFAPTGAMAVVAQEPVPSLSQGGATIWAADDNLGTPRDLVNNSGTLANHRVFSAFGQDVYESDPSLSYWVGFEGGHLDPSTGLVLDYHRAYDPATAKWLSNDPKGFSAGDTDLSRYVANNATGAFDATGLDLIPYIASEGYTGPAALRGAPIFPPGTPVFGAVMARGGAAPGGSWLDRYSAGVRAWVPGANTVYDAAGDFLNSHAAWVAPADASDGRLLAETGIVAVVTTLAGYGAYAYVAAGPAVISSEITAEMAASEAAAVAAEVSPAQTALTAAQMEINEMYAEIKTVRAAMAAAEEALAETVAELEAEGAGADAVIYITTMVNGQIAKGNAMLDVLWSTIDLLLPG